MVVLLVVSAGVLAAATTPERIALTRERIAQWVETEKQISAEWADWQVAESLLTQTLALLQAEEERLDAALAALEADRDTAAEERLRLQTRETVLMEAQVAGRGVVAALEARLRGFSRQLPEPLQESIEPLLDRMPAMAAGTTLGLPERVQTLVATLNEIDRFNRTVTPYQTVRPDGQGRSREMRGLYWGLAGGYAVDRTGTVAEVAFPGEDGWEWRSDSVIAAAVKDALAVETRELPGMFIVLPAQIHGPEEVSAP